YLCDEVAIRYEVEPSAALAGLWSTLLTDALVAIRERAYGHVADQDTDRICALACRLDLAVRENNFRDSATRDIQR
ncbi:unnamed protein product, partial [Choristocarpus tenellus]